MGKLPARFESHSSSEGPVGKLYIDDVKFHIRIEYEPPFFSRFPECFRYGFNRKEISAFIKQVNFKGECSKLQRGNIPDRFRYDIFAVNRAEVDTVTYGMKIETEKKREEFIRFSLDYSDIETDLVPRTSDKILTLATCSGMGYATRWVVQGVLNKEGSYIINDPYLMK